MDYKKGLFLACIGFVMLTLFADIGLSWVSGYNNRVEINVSSASQTYNGVAVPFTLNSTILGIDPCKDTYTCNDSLVTDTSDNVKYHYIEYYNASDDFRLFVNVTSYSPTISTYYFYYNNSNLVRPSTYKGSRVAYRVNDFENYTNDTRVSSDFGVFSLPANEPRTLTDCYKGGSCIVQTTGDGIIYGLLTYSYGSGILEYRYKTYVPDHNDATFYIRSGLNGTETGAVASIGSLLLAGDVWTKIKIEWFVNNTVGVTWDNANGYKSVNAGTNLSQIAFPLYSSAIMPMYLDNFIVRQLIEDPTVSYGAIENAPPVTDDFLILNYINPDFLNISADCDNITMTINPQTSEYPIINCSLFINNSLNYTALQPLNDSLVSTELDLANGSYSFFWECYAGSLYNTTINYTLNVMCSVPPAAPCTNCTLYYPINEGWTYTKCLNNGSLYKEKIYKLGCNNCNYSEIETCKYGCEGDKCNVSLEVARTNMFYLIILLFAAILIVVMIAKFYR